MESYETGSSCNGRVNDGGGCDANDRRIAQIEKAFGSAGQVWIGFGTTSNVKVSI